MSEKDIQNPYNQKVFEGFETACNEIGIEAVYKAPTSATADKQIEIINELIDNNVDGIAISANDADALESSLTEALNSGIEVISVDAPVNSISRKTHIQQADPEVLGRNFIKSAYDVSNGEGGFCDFNFHRQCTESKSMDTLSKARNRRKSRKIQQYASYRNSLRR